MELDVLDHQGTPVEKVSVADKAFAANIKVHLLHQVVRMQLANRRQGTASTKTRGEVRGGGRKPWRQKGTGRARQGSNRSPVWRGGGVALGPKPREYAYKLPKKVRRGALSSALSMKVQEGMLKVMDNIDINAPKTKLMVSFLKALGVEQTALILLSHDMPNVRLAARNLPYVKVLRVEGINVHDLLSYDYLICSKDDLIYLQERVAL